MPIHQSELTIPRAIADAFAFYAKPANLIDASPPDFHLILESGPEELCLGAVITIRGRRWGVTHKMVTEVTQFDPPALIVDEQREGPFKKWVHTSKFEEVSGGTKVIEHIDFEPPGGMLGLLITARVIERDLKRLHEYRANDPSIDV